MGVVGEEEERGTYWERDTVASIVVAALQDDGNNVEEAMVVVIEEGDNLHYKRTSLVNSSNHVFC